MQYTVDRFRAVLASQSGQGGVEYVLVILLAVAVVGIITAVTKNGGFESGVEGVINAIFGKFMER
ncbi:MAG: hypothetical protein ACRDJT_00430 [Actinomycetota bacterium]